MPFVWRSTRRPAGWVELLSIGMLTPGSEDYYLSLTSDAKGVDRGVGRADEYYSEGGESPGEWVGAGGTSLGLAGEVVPDHLRSVLSGCHPVTGGSLVSSLAAGRRSRPGMYLTFSAPKGVSLLGLLGDGETATAVLVAHRDAVTDALGYLERNALFARRGRDGAHRVATGGFVAAGFLHKTSRAGDPQIHTHVLVANLVQATDGGWSAPDSRTLFRHARTAGFLYQASLRSRLTRTLGLGWGAVRSGMAEPAGIPPAVLREFSTRRRQIEQHLSQQGLSGAASAQVAAHATRAAKDHKVSLEVLRESWKIQAASVGLDQEQLRSLVRPGREPRPPVGPDGLVDVLVGPVGLTANATTFDRRDLLRALAEAHPEGATARELEALADRVLTDERVVLLSPTPTSDTPAGREGVRWTTADMFAVEAAVVDFALRRRTSGTAVVPQDLVEAAILARPTLSVEQRLAVMRLTADGEGVSVLVGRAGTGKTFALDAARQAWTDSGRVVIGAAPSARAAAELQAGSGIASVTLARLLLDAETPGPEGGLPRRGVVVVDEAGMAGTRDLHRLLQLAERDNVKVVLVGDPDQLPEINAGGSLRALAERLSAPELVDNRRQREEWERSALADLRAGKAAAAVEVYRDHGRLVICPTAHDTQIALVGDWWEARSEGTAAMFALRRSEVDSLNRLARSVMSAAGRLGDVELVVNGRCFSVGDEVVALRNNRRIGLTNGTRATVTDIDPAAGELAVATDTEVTVRVPAGYLAAGNLDHGYAFTVHKGQGATVDRAFLLGTDALYREAGYVGMSRGRQANNLYVVADPDDSDLHTHAPGEKVQTEPVVALAQSLSISRSHRLALDTGHVTSNGGANMAQLEARRDALLDHGGPLDTVAYEALTAAMVERRRLLTRAALANPPDYLLDRLGPPPPDGIGRAHWAEAAGAVEVYRERFHIRDTDDTLGPEPDDPWRRAAREHTAQKLRATSKHLGVGDDRDVYLGVGR